MPAALPGLDAVACASFEDVFAGVEGGDADLAMIPIDNSLAGRVADIHHFLPASNLHIVAEHFLRIQFALMALPGATIDQIRTVHDRVTEAEARLADAKAEVQRPDEIEVLEAALAQAQAMREQADNNLDRARSLFGKGWITKAQLDDAVAQHDRNRAAVAEAEKRIAAAKLPGRSDMIDAAAANAEAARHALAEAEKSLGKREVLAPAGGTVEEVYFRPGEVVNAGQAVVSLLPPRNLKVRFFVAEPERAGLRLDQRIAVTCDGCPPDLHAKISFIAREAEFTPPVIFSREQRQKLVYLVEARPDGAATELTAGQPVTVKLAQGEQMVRR